VILILLLYRITYTDKFGYGRVPASSTPVENEFNKLKNLVINNSLRVDNFVEEHIKYLIGRVIIADKNIYQNQIDVSNIQSYTHLDVESNHKFQDNLDFAQENINLLQNTETDIFYRKKCKKCTFLKTIEIRFN